MSAGPKEYQEEKAKVGIYFAGVSSLASLCLLFSSMMCVVGRCCGSERPFLGPQGLRGVA